MDLKSYSRWYDYSRARDEMFAATDTELCAVVRGSPDDKKRAGSTSSAICSSRSRTRSSPREKVKLPKRQKAGDYQEPNYPYKLIDEKF